MTYSLTTFAEQRLTDILDYTFSEYGENAVNKLSRAIDKDILLLTLNPYMGKKEDKRYRTRYEVRSLVELFFKILYVVDEKNECIVILDFFDCRQAPSRMEEDIN
ncbi:type II toxin-antitoxin system RelE/ParE family toxin [Parabacteroides sp. PF5-6]|uniref:type II toxin-antitoxin system RelE/ParE family toxin n=1 Tax=Parabacteroides sp. PF5-6 TaxID=1742403 RepID=UPI002404A3E0|nr:type II toxin-antitoxin system RelE/ParE family toxin [Parabacteroides sp. PF5-6]MDF9829458.1 plasmid stabilization system protein ParE [Parabacteroides sp. PF5-6]